jgi:hypothetical protein
VSLFTQRQAALEEASARARGEEVDGLVDEAPTEFRQQLVFAIRDAATWPVGPDWQVRNLNRALIDRITDHLREEYGRPYLAIAADKNGADLGSFIVERATTPELMDVIDAVIDVFLAEGQSAALRSYAADGLARFADTVSRRMKQHKLAYDLVELQVVEKRSEELHQATVAPALTLLHGRPRFAEAERQYRDALDELADGKWADAVTDASAAVENLLRAILGLRHGALADLLGQGRLRGLFGDAQSARIKKVIGGFTALADVRNEESDAHGNQTDPATAWLAVHWAGALIVYLVQRSEAIGI